LDISKLPSTRSEFKEVEKPLNFELLFNPKYSNVSKTHEFQNANEKISNFIRNKLNSKIGDLFFPPIKDQLNDPSKTETEIDLMKLSYQDYDANFPLTGFFMYHGSFTTPSCDGK
jgi:hypothetical protein